jgi:hypothetical protein
MSILEQLVVVLLFALTCGVVLWVTKIRRLICTSTIELATAAAVSRDVVAVSSAPHTPPMALRPSPPRSACLQRSQSQT